MTTPLFIQFVGLLLTALVLDGDVMLKCFLAGSLLYWLFLLYREYSRCAAKTQADYREGAVFLSGDFCDRFLLKYGILVFFVGIYGLVQFLQC